ncbi:MAG: SUMF1/EgtB/PvdO family nonheme iron enzyme [Verrucomicrobia bacterium]|nr:SUMF1/EgtB/PvdO family nonheme iron enzyme [Verrucomicrobiota bacterium]
MKQELQLQPSASSSSTDAFPSTLPSRKLPSWLPLILWLSAMPPSLTAETLTIDRQITGIDHRFTPPDPVSGNPGLVQDVMVIDSAALTNVDLSQYQTFKLRLFAPAGQKLVANHGDGYRSSVNLNFVAGKDTVSHSESAVLEFENFMGAMPTRESSNFFICDGSNGIIFQANELYPGGGTGFTAMSYSFTPAYNPANSPKNFEQNAAIIGCPMCFSYETTAATDPGPLVSLAEDGPIPQLLNYQGRIARGTPAVNFEGPGQFKFALVNTDGTETFWSNDGTSNAGSEPAAAVTLQVTKGLYSVLLGDILLPHMTAIPMSVFTHGDVRLRVWFNDGTNGSQLLTSDHRIAAVGYAMMADNVKDGAITGAKLAAGAVGAVHITAGAVGGTQLAPDLTASGTLTAGTFQGSGAGLTGIPASAVVPAPPGMVLIPAGTFTMGNSVAADTDITDAVPVSVTLSAYYLAVNEVTLSQWQAVYYWATSNGYTFTNAGAGKGANHPVHSVNWYDCAKWCNARSEMENLTPCYTVSGVTYKTGESNDVACNWTASGYRLPSEAEWEKAARGGLVGQRFPWGDTITQDLANYYGNTSYSYDLGPNGYNPIGSVGGTSPATSPVGSFAANGYGINDMAGNVLEWCWDWYGTPYAGGSNPRGPTSGSVRVRRGGSWSYFAGNCRAAHRSHGSPGFDFNYMGFRPARSSVP